MQTAPLNPPCLLKLSLPRVPHPPRRSPPANPPEPLRHLPHSAPLHLLLLLFLLLLLLLLPLLCRESWQKFWASPDGAAAHKGLRCRVLPCSRSSNKLAILYHHRVDKCLNMHLSAEDVHINVYVYIQDISTYYVHTDLHIPHTHILICKHTH